MATGIHPQSEATPPPPPTPDQRIEALEGEVQKLWEHTPVPDDWDVRRETVARWLQAKGEAGLAAQVRQGVPDEWVSTQGER